MIYMMPKMYARGSVFDTITISIVVLAFALTLVFSHVILSEFITAGSATVTTRGCIDCPEYELSILNTTFLTQGRDAIQGADTMIPFIIAMLMLGSIIFAILNPSHPIFFVVGMISLVIFMMFIPTMANIYDEIATNSAISASGNQFPITAEIFRNYPLIFLIVGIVILIFSVLGTTGGRSKIE